MMRLHRAKINFLELVELFSKYDSVTKLHLDAVKEKQGTPKRPLVSLLSNRTQNDLIKALAISVKHVFREEIQESRIFSILLNETTDVSHTEQVSFVVRYVHNMKIKERFIQVCNVHSTSGDALESLLMAVLEENDLKIENIRDQGYDGAASMKEKASDQCPLELKNPEEKELSDTRWACRESALKTLVKVTAVASDALQQKDMDLAAAYSIVDGVLKRLAYSRTEEEFENIYQQATEKAASEGLDPPSEVPGQARRRKVPEKFKFDHAFPTLLEYYRVKVYYVFVDTMIQELHRRFKGGDNSKWENLHAFHCLAVPENWKTASIPTAALQAVKKLCQFYNIED
ncbi:unnamed protein product [Leuciscus chuanchicus]